MSIILLDLLKVAATAVVKAVAEITALSGSDFDGTQQA